jgi:hypothetical protein
MWLNLLLLALVAIAAWQLRVRWLAARETEKAILDVQAKPVTLPPVTTVAPTPAVTAANYMEVASKTLFSADRNPEVVVTPPPAPVMPPLPFARGMMTIEGKTIIIMSVKAGAPDHGYSPGDTIGDFKLISVHGNVLTFDWNGEKVVRNFDELREKNPVAAAQNTSPPAGAPQPSAAIEVVKSAAGPGAKDEASGNKNCVANDNTPAGTVQDGYKKVVQVTPFGSACRWEPVK